jgi:hypothetical protein
MIYFFVKLTIFIKFKISGRVFFDSNLNTGMEIKPLIVHINYRVGIASKLRSLKEKKLWDSQ